MKIDGLYNCYLSTSSGFYPLNENRKKIEFSYSLGMSVSAVFILKMITDELKTQRNSQYRQFSSLD